MRIQHNITAMNAYRNYANNTSAIGKNLEKLSSGYKINRAGDDAAGLAVSQKMRLQIAGLEQAQKNAKSGISLVQTAEGALTEVHDMLERMYTIAEQSANGTFDNDTDRMQLQKELDQLRTEIDRIGKTANFNGIALFDATGVSAGGGAGGAGGTGGGTTEASTITAADITAPKSTAVTIDGANNGTATKKMSAQFSIEGIKFAKAGIVTVTLGGKKYDVAVDADMSESDFAKALNTAYDKDKISTGDSTGGDLNMTVAGSVITLESGTMAAAINGKLSEAIGTDISITPKDTKAKLNTTAPTGKTESNEAGFTSITFTADSAIKDGTMDAFNTFLKENEGLKITATTTLTDGALADGNKIALSGLKALKDAGYTLSIGSNKVDIDNSGAATLTAANAAAANSFLTTGKKATLTIKDMYGSTVGTLEYDLTTTANLKGSKTAEFSLTAGASGTTETTGSFVEAGSGTQKLDATITPTIAAGTNTNWTDNTSASVAGPADGDKIVVKVDGKDYTVNLVNAANADNDKIKTGEQVNIDTCKNNKELLAKVQEAVNTQMAATNATAEKGTSRYNKVENLVLVGDGSGNITGTYDSTAMKYETEKSDNEQGGPSASEIWFAIGPEAVVDNTLSLGKMYLGSGKIGVENSNKTLDVEGDISGIDISTQQGGWDALDVIKNATNAVSDMRGTLGAVQNRLDHTINNLSVMQENMQDAESVIRDTDVAEEMMAYTKNNILVQSAQAMLAQANQLPQGVLQLLG